jgi:hypothetical protein
MGGVLSSGVTSPRLAVLSRRHKLGRAASREIIAIAG